MWVLTVFLWKSGDFILLGSFRVFIIDAINIRCIRPLCLLYWDLLRRQIRWWISALCKRQEQ
ncbi:hypothetical protein WK91_30710 [Burkholderia cepacia]|nr:hypothetical protein WK91_30710 [Burkholderia cepacia]